MPSTRESRIRLILLMVAILAVAGAAFAVVSRSQGSAQPDPAPESATTVAVVDGQSITLEAVESTLTSSLAKLEDELYNLKRDRLETMIGEILLKGEASKRGLDMAQLIDAEITKKAKPVTDAEVEAFYEANKARIQEQGNAPADIKLQIRQYLVQQNTQARGQAYIAELRSSAKVAVTLPGPPVRRISVQYEGAPIRGDVNAPVTIVEFSDFHCPFCRRVQPTLLQLLTKYPGKVRIAYKDLPLDSLHPQAKRASEAARCARDQGKFWEYHDKIYAGNSDSSAENLRSMATAVGLDVAAFESCLATGQHRPGIQTDLTQASQLGLNGTPAFFINGRALSGAQPLEAFVEIIDAELRTTSAQ
ncbi:MAG: thioredoxin domain-containing protein [Vicinamibacterales bacterium]